MWPHYVGNDDWAIDPAHVENMLTSKAKDTQRHGERGQAHGGGVWERFSTIRKDIEQSYFIKDSQEIPKDKVIENSAPCYRVHHGLCCHRDADIYHECLELAAFIERHFTKALESQFFLLCGEHAKDLSASFLTPSRCTCGPSVRVSDDRLVLWNLFRKLGRG